MTCQAEEPEIFKADYLSNLNDQQRAAVEYLDGPQLVIAGAGSGKTRVLAYKIVHLLAKGYEPWRIMALTFTNKAAREMRQRVASLVGERNASRLIMGTFHSVFARIIRSHADRLGLKSTYTIYDASDSKNLIKTIIKEMNLDDKIYKPGAIANSISNAKNALISPAMYKTDREILNVDKISQRPLTGAIYEAYVTRCRRADALDFDDLLYYMNVLLRDNPEIRRHYEEFLRYVLVDEYQDTNFAQHMIIDQLCRTSQGLCVVGDDAQSIYSFRGANIANILSLGRTFPSLKTFKLERNYRSTQNIINAAGSLISANKKQIPKKVFSQNGVGSPVDVVRSFSDYEESFLVANRISQLKLSTKNTFDDFAVLYRTNAQSRVLEESLRKRNIPYRIYGGLSFYQRKEIKDIVAYLRLALNPDDEEALKRVINFPARGIGDTTLKKLTSAVSASASATLWQVVCDPLAFGVNINSGTKRKIDGFVEIINAIVSLNSSGATAYDVVSEVYQRTGVRQLYMYDNTPENISKLDNIDELLAGVHSFVSQAQEVVSDNDLDSFERADSLAQFMTQVSLATDVDTTDSSEQDNEPKVTLMTIHASKGLEFDNVFVVGVEDELLPSAMSKNSIDQIEEERRLLYVAITRAKHYCMLSYASSRYRNGQTVYCKPSPFLKDISSKFIHSASGNDFDSGISRHKHINPVDNYISKLGNPVTRVGVSAKSYSAGTNKEKLNDGTQEGSSHSLNELAVGVKINHPRFGNGVIVDIDSSNPTGARIKVQFDNVDVKVLMLKFAKFTIL